jgi:hypothetical protein
MFTTVIVNSPVRTDESLSFVAPLGSGAYSVDQPDSKTVRIYFAMIKPGESGLKCLLRARSEVARSWQPCAARPENQRTPSTGEAAYTQYTFVYESGSWKPSTDILANFMRAMSAARNLPSAPPTQLAAFLKDIPKAA